MTTSHHDEEMVTVRIERHLAASPDQIHDAWLTPASVCGWMSRALQASGLPGDVRRVEIDPTEGGAFTFSDQRDEGEAVHFGRYLVIERPSRIVFTWFTSDEEARENRSTVTLSLSPEGTGTRAVLEHRMSAKWRAWIPQTERGWARLLEHSGAIHAPTPG